MESLHEAGRFPDYLERAAREPSLSGNDELSARHLLNMFRVTIAFDRHL